MPKRFDHDDGGNFALKSTKQEDMKSDDTLQTGYII